MVQVSLLMANCRSRLREAAARGSARPLDDVPFDPNRFVPRPVEVCECAGHLDASDGEEAMEEAVLFGEDVWGSSSHLACECATHGGSFTCA